MIFTRWVQTARKAATARIATSSTGKPNNGFTLIEVLVAFAIMALTLAALLQVFSTGLRSVDVSERHLMASMLARSVLDDLGTEIPIAAGEQSGDIDDGYRWVVRIANSQTIAPVTQGETAYVPYEIAVEISWNGRPITTLTTLRVVPEPATLRNDSESLPPLSDDGSN